MPSQLFPLAGSEGDASEGLYTDAWIEDIDGDGVPEIVFRTCTFLWPGADNFDPSQISVYAPVLYTYSNGQYNEKSTFEDPDNRYVILAIIQREEAIRNETRNELPADSDE